MSIVQILKNHKWAVVFGLMIAILVASFQIYFRYDNKDIYQGIEIMGDSPWTARIREIQDGHPLLGSIYFKEGKNDPYLFQPLGSILSGYLGSIFSLDINNTILLARLVFPFLVFLVIYAFVFLLSKDKSTALTSSIVIILAKVLFTRYGIFKILDGISPRSFLRFARPVIPALPTLFLFSFLLLFWLFLEKKHKKWGVLSVMVLGFSFYDYFYTWTFLYAFCGVLALIFLFQRKMLEVKKIIAILIGASLIALPYLLNIYRATTYPNYEKVSQRFGVVENRTPDLGLLISLILFLFLLFFPKKRKNQYFFTLALVLTPFVTLNQQIITGKMLQSSHYHWFFHVPLAIIYILIMFFAWVSRKNWKLVKKISTISMIILSIYVGIFIQVNSYASMEQEAIDSQRYGLVMEWLNNNSQKEDIVFANDEISYFTVIYTPLNVFYHRAGIYSFAATNDRLLNSVFAFYRLDGVKRDEAKQVFFENKEIIAHEIYGMYYRESVGSHGGIPDEVIGKITEQYQQSLLIPDNEFLNKLWTEYQVKYVVWDKKNEPQWQMDQYSFLQKTAQYGDIAIYQKK